MLQEARDKEVDRGDTCEAITVYNREKKYKMGRLNLYKGEWQWGCAPIYSPPASEQHGRLGGQPS